MTITKEPELPTQELERVTIRFAGDSGDGMQLTGTQFTRTAAVFGNDISTLPDFPAEIRAPAGSLPGVSGFQISFSSTEIHTPGDAPDVLVAMNPAALKTNIGDLPAGGALIVNSDAFTQANLNKAAYAANPLTDGSLKAYTTFEIPISSLNERSLDGLDMTTKQKDLTKNFFALGIMFWLYERSMDPTLGWIDSKFSARPVVAEANKRALRAGYAFGETTEMFHTHYRVRPAKLAPGTYRNITGNEATALGFLTASRLADRPLFYGSYPITPASDILHQLSGYKTFGVKTFQAEDEIAAIGAAIGASYGGALGLTASSGPGIALKTEAMGLAVMVELPLVVIDVQRAGPSTGMPTKNEQADLLQVMFGRNSDSPIPIVAPATPGECFDLAIEAARIALKYMTPVVYLSDAFLATGSEPWPIPDLASLPEHRGPECRRRRRDLPALPARSRDARPTLGRAGHGRPRAPHRRPREGGRHGQRQLRPGQPPQDADAAPAEGRGHRERHRPARGHGTGDRRAADARLGLDLWRDPLGGRAPAGGGPVGRTRAPAPPQPVPGQHRGGAAQLPPGPHPRSQPGPAAAARPGEIPHRCRRLRPRSRQAVPHRRDRRRGRASPRGEPTHMTTDATDATEPVPPQPALSAENAQVIALTRKDFVSDQEVRWCPGCGDYSILAQTQKVMPDFGYKREDIVFISGIGCSGRLPYYMNTYGFHTIHGRAPTLATGLKAARPDLMVWVITGDGDALSIGGNHVIHSMRRNVDINMVMFNNRIYGLTKGQASPTSEFGKKTKSTPVGSIDTPIIPLTIALAAEASFVARSVDTHTEHLQQTLERGGRHKGSSFIEVLQNCNIFNDGAWRDFTDREVREDRMLVLEHGKPMIFGKDRDKGIRLDGLKPEVVTIGENGVTEADLLVHDETAEDPYLALVLSRMFWPDFPVPVGVLRATTRPTHDRLLEDQVSAAIARSGPG